MTRFIHDRFAKELLEELLSPIGTVNVGRDVASEVREIDVYFTETSPEPQYTETLGVLGRIASGTAILEPFRNPVSVSEVCSCLGKLLEEKILAAMKLHCQSFGFSLLRLQMLC
jgi:hypothetical protein